MVAMTAPWTVPASGAQFPFGPCFAFLAPPTSLSPLPHVGALTLWYACIRTREHAAVYVVPCTCTGMYTRLQSVPRSGGRASSGCPLQWAKPTGQPQPAPTSRSDDHWDCALSYRDWPRFPRLSLFPFDLGVMIARLRQTLLVQAAKKRMNSFRGLLSKSSDCSFTSLTEIIV